MFLVKFLKSVLILGLVLIAAFFGWQLIQNQQNLNNEELKLKEKELELKEKELQQQQESKKAQDLGLDETRKDSTFEQSDDEYPASDDETDTHHVGSSLVSGKVRPEQSSQFKRLPSEFSTKAIYVHAEAYSELVRMMKKARSDGIDLRVMSGFRSYEYQKGIWDRKWNSFSSSTDSHTRIRQILRYSSLPGISRHHWGTDVDFNDVSYAYWRSPKGQKILQWLRANAHKFSFCEVYAGKSDGQRTGGYEDEPWHWSYLPIANDLQHQREQSMSEVVRNPINGREALAGMKKELSRYVTSISPQCR